MASLPQFIAFAALAGTAVGLRADVAADDSPFMPSGAAAASAAAAQQDFQLAGASATGQGTAVCIFNVQTHHSSWIAVGSSGDGVQVLSYDPSRDQAVVVMNGERRVLAMRKATVTPGPMPVLTAYTAPVVTGGMSNEVTVASAQPAAPLTPKQIKDEHDAREARMLISDLMEIGAQQRKAYAEALARQKAAQAAAGSQ